MGGACVKPLKIEELINEFDFTTEIEYGPTNGDAILRKKISALYPETTSKDVLVTIGTAEAISLPSTTP